MGLFYDNQGLVLILLISCSFWMNCNSNHNNGTEQSTVRIYEAIEELRIEQFEGDEEYVFGGIGGIAVGKDGDIFISDSQVPIVRMYDKQGKFIKNVGRKGEGPGEYLRISEIKTFPGSNKLLLWDATSMRASIYTPEGHFIESHHVNSSLHSANTLQIDMNENYYVKYTISTSKEYPNWHFVWLKMSHEGTLLDTIPEPLDIENRPQSFVLFTSTGSAHPFIKWPITSMSSMGYLISGRNDEYSFTLHLPDSSKKEVTRNIDVISIENEEKTQWENWVNYYNVDNTINSTKPAFKNIITESQGRIWVHKYVKAQYTDLNVGPHYGPDSNWWEPPTFDVFTPNGEYEKTVTLPFNVRFQDAKDDIVWGIIKGDYDERYVGRFRLNELQNM